VSQIFFVGTYTQGDFGAYQAQGKGIYTCRLESTSGEMDVLHCNEDIINPTYVTLNKAKTHLYAVQETGAADTPSVHAFAINDDHSLRRLNMQGMTGEGPCHLMLDAQEDYLAVANYGSGNIVLYPINEDGSLGEQSDSVQHEGKGPNPNRQESPHAHAAVFGPDGTLFVADLGLDEVKAYAVKDAKLEPLSSAKTPAGAGPRHLVFHPSESHAFVLNELDSTLSLFRHSRGRLELLNTLSTLPEGDQTESYCAAIRIHPSGKFVYASNRGHDSLAVFAFDKAGESLNLIQLVSTGGQYPRDFNLDPDSKLVVAANQQTNNLITYRLDAATGKLGPTGQELEIGTPVCVAMA